MQGHPPSEPSGARRTALAANFARAPTASAARVFPASSLAYAPSAVQGFAKLGGHPAASRMAAGWQLHTRYYG